MENTQKSAESNSTAKSTWEIPTVETLAVEPSTQLGKLGSHDDGFGLEES